MPRISNSVHPLHKDTYYVYALCKPCGTPFYIGKGKNSRINHHFKATQLVKNTPKNNTIKKYGDKIKREILSYFSTENLAFDFEEYLISYYGTMSEGGLLTNYAKTRYEYAPHFVEDVCKKAHLGYRKYKYSEDVMSLVYRSYFVDNLTMPEISTLTGIDLSYMSYLLNGKKHKKLYDKYKELGIISEKPVTYKVKKHKQKDIDEVIRLRNVGNSLTAISKMTGIPKTTVGKMLNQKPSQAKVIYKVSDCSLKEAFAYFKSGTKNYKELSTDLGVPVGYLRKVFTGYYKPHLKLRTDPIKKRPIISEDIKNKIVSLSKEGFSYSQIIKETGASKTSVARIIKKSETNQ